MISIYTPAFLSERPECALAKLGIKPVRGRLDDAEVLAKAAHDADVTVNAADAGPASRSAAQHR